MNALYTVFALGFTTGIFFLWTFDIIRGKNVKIEHAVSEQPKVALNIEEPKVAPAQRLMLLVNNKKAREFESGELEILMQEFGIVSDSDPGIAFQAGDAVCVDADTLQLISIA